MVRAAKMAVSASLFAFQLRMLLPVAYALPILHREERSQGNHFNPGFNTDGEKVL